MSAGSRTRRPGFTLVELLVVMAIIALLIGLLLPAVQSVREAASRTACANNLRQIGLACRLYESAKGTLPPSFVREQGASWMVLIMPYLEQKDLFDRWDLAKKYYDQSDLVRQYSLKLYFCPSRRSANDNYQSISGDVPTILISGICGPTTMMGPGPTVPGALSDYAGNIGLADT
jgi:prepilin-type N-terminal cleavage/methylation domain-containing protein